MATLIMYRGVISNRITCILEPITTQTLNVVARKYALVKIRFTSQSMMPRKKYVEKQLTFWALVFNTSANFAMYLRKSTIVLARVVGSRDLSVQKMLGSLIMKRTFVHFYVFQMIQ